MRTCNGCNGQGHLWIKNTKRHCHPCDGSGKIPTGPSIQGKELDESDIGRNVTYVPSYGHPEYGELSSFRPDGAIFVRFKGPNGERCDPSDLRWG